MIKTPSWQAILSNANCFPRFRRLVRCFMAAAASNSLLSQRDFNRSMSFRRLSSAASSAIDSSRGKFFAYGFSRASDKCNNVLRNCIDPNSDRVGVNEALKARAYGPSIPQLLDLSEEVVRAEDQRRTVDPRVFNGDASANWGNSAGARDHSSSEKIMIAVDVDEVLGNFVSALNRFIADRYSLNHSVSEYHVYEFFKIWNCSRGEADHRVHEFFKTPYFKKGINPIPGAREALEKLSEVYNLSIVTSRQNAIKDHTIEWIEKHYPGLFREIHFGNHFALDGKSRPKSDICKSLGAKVLIDDNPRYAVECAAVGIKVLLFDYENSYPWCKTEHAAHQHPLVTKVHNWEEVEQQLSSLLVS